MKRNIKKIITSGLLAVGLFVVLNSCNKDVEAPQPIGTPVPQGLSITEVLTLNSDLSLLRHALNRAGFLTAFSNRSAVFTLFAPVNTAFTAAGLGTTTAIDAMPLAQLTSILNYHVLPGVQINSGAISTTFPNSQMPSNFIFPSPNTNPLVRFSIFPSRRTAGAWLNNIPVSSADVASANGVVHKMGGIVLPPSRVLLDTIARDPDFTMLVAAIIRADSDLPSTSTSRFQYALGEPLASLTVFAPTNNAFKGLINVLTAGAIPLAAPDATFIAFINTLPLITLKGIIAYHVMGQRSFSVNYTTTATNYPTLLNGSVPTHPGLSITSTITNGLGVALSVKGVVNATASNAVAAGGLVDRHAINGNFFKIDQVLLPQ